MEQRKFGLIFQVVLTQRLFNTGTGNSGPNQVVYNQGGLQIKGCKLEGLLYVSGLLPLHIGILCVLYRVARKTKQHKSIQSC